MFHGYKGLYSENDVLIVSKAFRVLLHMLPIIIPSLILPTELGVKKRRRSTGRMTWV
jgi:hypothetical protein